MVSARASIVHAVLGVAAAALVGAGSPAEAFAHALLSKSEPAHRAVLSRPPAQLRLWFSERLEPAFSTASVLDAGGKSVAQDAARVSAQDPKLLELPLPPLGPGTYTVQYKVLSVDGHTVKASFKFSIKGP